ncbi:hypothetical protein AZA_26595 [Nitrospirillum viridazoti Y2]|nr:hypothetical protein AZA_26595 [Nitrospirillum amazonense Y2]
MISDPPPQSGRLAVPVRRLFTPKRGRTAEVYPKLETPSPAERALFTRRRKELYEA